MVYADILNVVSVNVNAWTTRAWTACGGLNPMFPKAAVLDWRRNRSDGSSLRLAVRTGCGSSINKFYLPASTLFCLSHLSSTCFLAVGWRVGA